MKISYLLAVLVAGLAFSGTASAASYTVTTDPSLYEVSGTLAKDTEITFTYTGATSPGSFPTVLGQKSTTNGATTLTEASFASKNNPATNNGSASTTGGILMVLTTAAIKGISFVTIENLTNKVVDFSALFTGTSLASAGSFTTSGPSAVPLPSAFALFLTGLLGLAGFATYRKAQNRA